MARIKVINHEHSLGSDDAKLKIKASLVKQYDEEVVLSDEYASQDDFEKVSFHSTFAKSILQSLNSL